MDSEATEEAGSEAAASSFAATGFAALGIHGVLQSTLARLGITEPTEVQQRAIPVLLEGHDLIACAPTGTGKTAAFLLPTMQRLAEGGEHAGVDRSSGAQPSPARRGPRRAPGARVLVLTPTRELAQQVSKAASDFAARLPRMSTVCITGGASYRLQAQALSRPHEILVATPGRLMDQVRGGQIDLSRIEVLVLDEADRMLDLGFADDVLEIASQLRDDRQTVCFTATLSPSVRELADRLLREPQWLTVERQHSDDPAIDDHVVYVDSAEHRMKLLVACLADEGLGQAIVFAPTKKLTEELSDALVEQGIHADALHGDMNQRDRTRTLNRLRRRELRVLIATDVAARGIDVASITHVVNFELPRVSEDYVHRIGRTGRAGASGQALSLVGRDEVHLLRRIERMLNRRIQVSAFDGLEARFDPTVRPNRPPRNAGKGGKGDGRSWSNNRGDRTAAGRPAHRSGPGDAVRRPRGAGAFDGR